MTTTRQAAALAGVTVATIRTWIRTGAVAARKADGRWLITEDSLTARIAIGEELAAVRRTARAERIARHADFTPYHGKTPKLTEQAKKRAYDKVIQILEDGSLVETGREGQYLAVSSDSTDKYLVDTHLRTCTCPANVRLTYCTHMTAADALEAHRGAIRPRLALVA